MSENYINHIALVLDASSSMISLQNSVIKVADNQISYLAQRSKELNQETRITVYVFSDTVRCVIYDKDVLRLPSIREFYRPKGMTALIDATIQSQLDLEATAQLYGDHAFLTYVLTDGQENISRKWNAPNLHRKLTNLPENWTVAVLVPDQTGVFEAKKFGFPPDNIAIWNVSEHGLNEASEIIRQSVDNFMVSRASGIRGSRSLFSTSNDALNKDTVKAAQLKPMAKESYVLLNVENFEQIRDFVENNGHQFLIGKAFYELTKPESIQPQKQVAVRNKKSGRIYTGPQARDLLGLPNMEVRVKPDKNPEYQVFIQSTSVNRKLVPGTKLLLLK